MKPLELHIYEKHPGVDGIAGPVYRVGGSFTPYAIVAKDKRFTGAELAAELFMQTAWLGARGRTYAADTGRNIIIEAAFTFGPITRDEHEWWTLSHFARFPHYDEADQ